MRLKIKIRSSSEGNQQKTHVVLSNASTEEPGAVTNVDVEVEADSDAVTSADTDTDVGTDAGTDVDTDADTDTDATTEEEETVHLPTVICAKKMNMAHQHRKENEAYNITPALLTISIF